MSAIAGFYRLDGQPAGSADLSAMLGAMPHRGAQGDLFCGASVALGPVRQSAGRGSAQAIAWDGRLDNRLELIGCLTNEFELSSNSPDTAIVVAAYARWGESCPDRLLGDFALAIWDENRQTLFCARDQLGVRPFCYYRSDRLFAFASEVGALGALADVPWQVNEGRVADYLVYQLEGIDKTSTCIENILRLPPGHTLTVSPGGLSLRRYWELTYRGAVERGTTDDHVRGFRDLFASAVACRMRPPGRAGIMLSGGIDSCSVAGFASSAANENGHVPVFSAISSQPGCAETRHIRSMHAQEGLRPTTVALEELPAFVKELDRVHESTDDLFDNFMVLPQLMCIAARRTGVTSLLTGADGDQTCSISPTYLGYLIRWGRLLTAVREARASSKFYNRYHSSVGLLWQGLRSAVTPAPVRLAKLALRRRRLGVLLQESVLNPDFARRIGLASRIAQLESHGPLGLKPTLGEYHAESINHPYLAVGLERYNRVAATYGIELSHPLLDRRLIDFCIHLPWDQKAHDGWSKLILRRGAVGRVPESICWRRGWENLNSDFGTRYTDLKRQWIVEAFEDLLTAAKPYIQADQILQIFAKFRTGQCTPTEYQLLWQALTLGVWLQRVRAHRPRQSSMKRMVEL